MVSTFMAADGSLLDAADKGIPGSVLTSTFTTVSTTAVPGTTLSGIVADPGPDDKPGTRDDVRAGADGVLGTADDVYLRPIQGVKVYIIGEENQAVYTDAQGRFSFSSVPSGDVKLAVEGNVSGVRVYDPTTQQFVGPSSEGFYFPQMTLDLSIQPGVANTVMGSMGTTQEMQANATNLGVYLPRVQSSILQTVSNTQPTTLVVAGESGLGLTPQQQSELTLTVQPNSLVGPDGQKMATGQVGISTVPPQIVMDMLPQGVMQHTFDITIQAPGVTAFSTPATLTFPNVFDAAPGTKLDVLSFDHTTGRLVIDGTATVSADGLTVVTDPGTGVTQPGWHGVTQPGSGGKTPPPSCPATPAVSADPPPTNETVLPLLSGDTPTPDELNKFSVQPPALGNVRTVTVTVDSQLQQVFTASATLLPGGVGGDVPVTGGTWTLTSTSSPITFNWTGISDANLLKAGMLDKFAIYGGVVTVAIFTDMSDMGPPDGRCASSMPPTETIDKFFIYRYLNPVYATQSIWQNLFSSTVVAAAELPFPDGVQAGPGHSTQVQSLDMHVSSEAGVTPDILIGEAFSVSGSTVTFNPPSAKLYDDTLELRPGVDLSLEGVGTARPILYLSEPALVTTLTNIYNHSSLPIWTRSYTLTAQEMNAFSPTNVQATADALCAAVKGYYAAAEDSIDVENGAGTDGVMVSYSTNEVLDGTVLGDTGFPYGSGIDNLSTIQRLVAESGTLGNTVMDYLLPQAINPNRGGKSTTVFLVAEINAFSSLTAGNLAAFMTDTAETIAHEAGHALSLVHILGGPPATYNTYPVAPGTVSDVMSYNSTGVGPWAFLANIPELGTPGSLPALQLGLDQQVTPGLVTAAASYYN
jgi:hypothetical protein